MLNKEIISDARHDVSDSIRRNTRQGFIGCGGCNQICMTMNKQLGLAENLSDIGDLETAFRLASFIYLRSVGLASVADSSSGMLTDSAGWALQMLTSYAKEISGTDRKLCVALVRFAIKESQKKSFENWEECRYDYLNTVIPIVDGSTAEKFEEVLTRFCDMDEQSVCNDYNLERNRTIRYKLHRHMQGKEHTDSELYSNLDIDDCRIIAIDDMINSGDFNKAEKLCKEKIRDGSYYYANDLNDWENVLYKIYKAAGWYDKMIGQAEQLLLRGGIQYWSELKAIYEHEGNIKDKYSEMLELIKSCDNREVYRKLLQTEKEYRLLLLDLQDEPNEIFTYGELLAKEYPDEVYAMCAYVIRTRCEAARERRRYRQVCRLITKLIKWGGKLQAQELVLELEDTYKGRPALVDELEELHDSWF